MRVLVVGLNYAPEPTGIAPYTTALAAGLAARGHRVQVLTAMPHYPEWAVREGYGGWAMNETIDGVRVRRLRHYIPSRPIGVGRLLSELSFGARVVFTRWGRPDIVVFVSPALFATALGMLKARVTRRLMPSSVWVQDLYSLGIVETGSGSSTGLVARIISKVESKVLGAASGVVVIHDRFAKVAAELGAEPESVAVVRNWTHLAPIENANAARTRQELGWGIDETIALHTGNMGVKQDLGNIVEAARAADVIGAHVRFVLTGDGSEREALQAQSAGIQRIQFIGSLPDGLYQQALAAADVLLVNEHQGLREMAVPSKLTSYFSSGRPIVAATDSESLTALEVSLAGAGIRVDPGRSQELLDAVLDLRADRDRADELGRSGLDYRMHTLSQSNAIDKYAEWLHDIRESSAVNSEVKHHPISA